MGNETGSIICSLPKHQQLSPLLHVPVPLRKHTETSSTMFVIMKFIIAIKTIKLSMTIVAMGVTMSIPITMKVKEFFKDCNHCEIKMQNTVMT